MQENPLSKRLLLVLSPNPKWDAIPITDLQLRYGPIDYRGRWHPFDVSGYYGSEMGEPLHRAFLSFGVPFDPSDLPIFKGEMVALEDATRKDGKRIYNLDCGFLDSGKFVLASLKPGPAKIYLGDGVYADLLVHYADGIFHPMPWAFPDFKDRRYDRDFRVMRTSLKVALRRNRLSLGNPNLGEP